jgi:site-specific DNA-methyltransferase (adenine-specific)
MSEINFYNIDNIEFMKSKPDNFYDLAIVDPPYGYGNKETAILNFRMEAQEKDWNIAPTEEYFIELFRVSKNQIIWGGNYFPFIWGFGGRCFIYWHKGNPVPNFADGELAWTSFDKNAIQIDYRYYGNLHGKTSAAKKLHPTQKPIYLYRKILTEFAQKGFKILDTHGGSHTHAIAADMEGFDLDICEIEKEYFNNGKKAFNEYRSQTKLF